MNDVTQILSRIESGDETAAEQLLPLLYDELRRLAVAKLAREKPGQTLQPTALVHEAYVRIVGSSNHHWRGRAHFFAAAAESMRRILVEIARHKRSLRGGGNWQRVDLSQVEVESANGNIDVLALSDALELLESRHP